MPIKQTAAIFLSLPKSMLACYSDMEPGQNEVKFLQNIVKCERTRSMCALEQQRVSAEETCHLASPKLHCSPKRHLFDIQQEVTTPNTKRIKQERDDYDFYKDKEQLLFPSETSLKNIASEVAYSLENNTCENILSIQGNSNFENVSRTRSAQGDIVIVLDHTETPKHSPQIAENTKETEARHENIEPLPYRADSRKETISVPSKTDQVHFEPKRPILRALKSPDSRGNNGFAFDHNFFPKLVGVHSISSTSTATTSSSTEIENHCVSQQTSELSPLEERGQDENINNPVTIQNDIDISRTDTSASPRTNPTLINCRTPSPTQKQYDLLFTFTQKDGQSDMFLVVNEEVFSVSRYDHKGNSYLAHTDNNGKTSILARLPEEAETASRNVPNEQRGTTNALSSATEQSRPTPSQRVASHYPTAHAASVAVTPVQTREPAPANIVQRRIPRVIRGRENNALPNADYVSFEHQAVYGSRNGTFNLETRQLSQRLDHLRTETAGHRQRELATDSSQWVPTDQKRFPPQTGASSQPRHHVVGNDSLQTSTVHMNAHSSLTNAQVTLNSLRNQQLELNQSTAARDERHSAINTHSEQLFTNTTTQRRYSGDTAVGNGFQGYSNKETSDTGSNMRYNYIAASPEDEKRIIYRNKLMNYIAHQLPSSEEPSTTNVSVNRRYEAADAKQSSCRTIANESFARRVQAGTRGEVAPHPQSHAINAYLTAENTDRHYTGKRNGPSVDNNLEIHDVVQRVPVNHMSRQNSGMLNSQPRSDAPDHNSIHLQGGLQENDGADSRNKVLEIIASWQRRQQQRISSEDDSLQLKELLLGTTPAGITGITTKTTAAEGTSSRETAERCRVVQTSRDTLSTPIISQVSYGVISRSMGGENVVPKRTATALVVDQGRSIYIDATDSVIDEERRPRIAGQRCSNEAMTIGPTRKNETTIQQHYSNGVSNTPSRPATNSHSRVVQMPHQSKSLSVNDGPRCYTSKMLPRLTSKFDKRCVANNKLKDIVQTIKSPREGHGVPTHVSGQQSYTDVAQLYNTDVDEVVEIIINPASKQVSQPKTIDHSKSVGKIGLLCGQQSSTDEKPSQSTPEVSKPCDDDDDDVVEIIYATPKPNATRDSQHISKVVPQCAPQICTEVSRSVEIANRPPKQSSQSKKVALLEDQQSCTDDSPLKRLLQARADEVLNTITTTSKEDNRPDTTNNPEHKDKYTIVCGQQISTDEMSSQSSVSTKTDGDEVAVITNLPAKQHSGPGTTECSENVEKDKSHLEKYIYNDTELKNIQQRDELLKKIKNTQERMAQEQIDWKKKYLFRLEVQLKKKLAKIPDVTEHARANNDNE